MRWSRANVAAGLAVAALVAAAVTAAVETNRSQWPEGVGVPAVEVDGTRTFSIDRGDEVTFVPGVARPGDVIVCEGIGVLTVGSERTVESFEVSVEPNGGVRARCGA